MIPEKIIKMLDEQISSIEKSIGEILADEKSYNELYQAAKEIYLEDSQFDLLESLIPEKETLVKMLVYDSLMKFWYLVKSVYLEETFGEPYIFLSEEKVFLEKAIALHNILKG